MPKYGSLKGSSYSSGKKSYANNVWVSMVPTLLTDEGREIVDFDQDIKDFTLSKLIESERELVPDKYSYILREYNVGQLLEEEIYVGHSIGIAHISQCILENKEATLAELIARYSLDRRIPFIVGAVIIKDLQKKRGLCYFDSSRNFAPMRWQPRKIVSVSPPKKGLSGQTDSGTIPKEVGT